MTAARKRRWRRGVGLTACLLASAFGVGPAAAQDTPASPAATASTEQAPLFNAEEIFAANTEVLRIDLPTALQLADADNPTIRLARARVAEAYAQLRQVQLLWLPDLQVAPQYLRHDGEIQNAAGVVFTTNKSAVFGGGGAVLSVDTGQALFAPLIARRLAEAQSAASRAVNNNIQLDVASAYLDLLEAYGQLAMNTNVLARDEEMQRQSQKATNAGLAENGADLNRAKAEVQLRAEERIALKGRVRVASSHLAKLLLLRPTTALLPGEPSIVPVMLVPETAPADDLVALGVSSRPELAEGRLLVAASETHQRQTKLMPLLPQLQASYNYGTFGGGQDNFVGTFSGRGDGAVGLVWDLKNLGFGNRALNRVERIRVSEANLHVAEVQAQVADEVNSALQIARARREVLDSAQKAVTEAEEAFRKLDLIAFGMTGPKKELETLEPLIAIQMLAQARTQYLTAVIDYNRAQFQLFTAMGRPSMDASSKVEPIPVEIPVVPPPFQRPAK